MTIPPDMIDFIYFTNATCTTYVQQVKPPSARVARLIRRTIVPGSASSPVARPADRAGAPMAGSCAGASLTSAEVIRLSYQAPSGLRCCLQTPMIDSRTSGISARGPVTLLSQPRRWYRPARRYPEEPAQRGKRFTCQTGQHHYHGTPDPSPLSRTPYKSAVQFGSHQTCSVVVSDLNGFQFVTHRVTAVLLYPASAAEIAEFELPKLGVSSLFH
jgi:hypothetical protein